jgi:hypothetical protein
VILEGLVTTLNADRTVNLAPMGPQVDDSMHTLVLKPYRTSSTYQNLKRTGAAVFHVTDDVELIAHAAVGTVDPLPAMRRVENFDGRILSDACRWYALAVRALDDRQDRTTIECEVVDSGRHRDFFGFNRAKHAVLEAAILATRTQFLAAEEVLAELDRLRPAVDKTGGEAERRAFEFLVKFVQTQYAIRHPE